MITFKQFVTEEPLLDIQFEMAIRLELKCSPDIARELVAWVSFRAEWEDLSSTARNEMRQHFTLKSYFDTSSGKNYSWWALNQLNDVLLDKYELDAKEIIG